MTETARLHVDREIAAVMDHGVPADLLALFPEDSEIGKRRDGATILRFPGRQIADRLAVLGADPEDALECLEATLDLARQAYSGIARGSAEWFRDPNAPLASLDAPGWLQRFANHALEGNIYAGWLLSILEDCGPLTILQLCLLARPRAAVTLELPAETEILGETPRPRMVLTRTARQADILKAELTLRHGHLDDLINIAHLGGGGEPADLVAQVRGLMRLGLREDVTIVSDRPHGSLTALFDDLPGNYRLLLPTSDDPALFLADLLEEFGVGWSAGLDAIIEPRPHPPHQPAQQP